jgi:AcrR family transcriptional regulator
MPKLKPEELESRRLEIIEAARACFLRSGFHQTTTDEICHEANITPGGLYHYFDSKDELIAAVIARSAETATERMRSLIEGADDAESAFRLVADFFFETMRDTDIDNVTRLEIEIWAEALKSDKLATTGRSAWKLRQDWLEALVQRGIDDGVYDAKIVDPRAMASLLLAIYIGLRVGRLLGGDTFDTAGAMRSLFMMHAGRMAGEIPEIRVPAR